MPGADWFPAARINYAEHAFRGRAPEAIALVHASELRPLASTTWRELEEASAAGIGSAGVVDGEAWKKSSPNASPTERPSRLNLAR